METTNISPQQRAYNILAPIKQHNVGKRSELVTGLEILIAEYFKNNIDNDAEGKSEKVLDAYQVFCNIVSQANEMFNIKAV